MLIAQLDMDASVFVILNASWLSQHSSSCQAKSAIPYVCALICSLDTVPSRRQHMETISRVAREELWLRRRRGWLLTSRRECHRL